MPDLDRIGELAKIEFHKARVKEMKEDKRFGLHVTSMLPSGCSRKTFYIQNDSNPRMDSESMAVFHAGKLEHAHSNVAGNDTHHEIPMAYNPFIDKPVDLDEALKQHPDVKNDPFWYDVIIGSSDDVLIDKINSDYIIADKKTKLTKTATPYKTDKPKQAHVEQLNYYALLLSKCKGINAKYGCILELDFANRLSNPNSQPFELDPIDQTRAEMIQKMAEYKKFAIKNQLPPRISGRDMDWLCFGGYCEWYSKCFDEEGSI